MAVAPDGSDAAVRVAVALAAREGRPLHVLHVVELTPVVEGAGAAGGHVLHDAVAYARDLGSDAVSVDGELAHGALVGRIVASAQTAAYVVLQQAVQPDVRGRRGEVGRQVSTRVGVPVVCVPRLWAGSPDPRVVTIAVKDPLTCGPLLRVAARAAAASGAELRVLHVGAGKEHAEARRLIDDQLDQLDQLDGQPGPAVTQVVLVGGDTVPALSAASRASELLVLGRHHRHHPGGSTLGSVAQALARRAACPVLLVDPRHSVSSGEWVFETDWA